MRKKASTLQVTIEKIEEKIIKFYGLNHNLSVWDFLIDAENLVGTIPTRASVFLSDDQNDEINIGVYFSEEIKKSLIKVPPYQQIYKENLDAFLVFVEEISHFHLLVNRANFNRKISQLELEYQGEIDKLLITEIFLREQYGSNHIYQLFNIIYERSIVCGNNLPRYELATYYAAKFWKMIQSNFSSEIFSDKSRKLFRDHHQMVLSDKLLLLTRYKK